MHIALSLFVIFATWRWGDWSNWKKYHTTMLFFALGNLLYNFLTANYFLWRLNPDFLANHTVTEMLYTFIIFPGTAFLFLSNFPKEKLKAIIHIGVWILIYGGVEWIFATTDRIHYQYGWSLIWSIAFDVLMFPMLLLFYKKPVVAYSVSIPIVFILLWLFDVPVDIPVEERPGLEKK